MTLKQHREIYDLKKGFQITTGMYHGKLQLRVTQNGSFVEAFPCVAFTLEMTGSNAVIKQKGKW